MKLRELSRIASYASETDYKENTLSIMAKSAIAIGSGLTKYGLAAATIAGVALEFAIPSLDVNALSMSIASALNMDFSMVRPMFEQAMPVHLAAITGLSAVVAGMTQHNLKADVTAFNRTSAYQTLSMVSTFMPNTLLSSVGEVDFFKSEKQLQKLITHLEHEEDTQKVEFVKKLHQLAKSTDGLRPIVESTKIEMAYSESFKSLVDRSSTVQNAKQTLLAKVKNAILAVAGGAVLAAASLGPSNASAMEAALGTAQAAHSYQFMNAEPIAPITQKVDSHTMADVIKNSSPMLDNSERAIEYIKAGFNDTRLNAQSREAMIKLIDNGLFQGAAFLNANHDAITIDRGMVAANLPQAAHSTVGQNPNLANAIDISAESIIETLNLRAIAPKIDLAYDAAISGATYKNQAPTSDLYNALHAMEERQNIQINQNVQSGPDMNFR